MDSALLTADAVAVTVEPIAIRPDDLDRRAAERANVIAVEIGPDRQARLL